MNSDIYFKNILLVIIASVIFSCESQNIHDPPEPPYRLTDVEITPENPTVDDTVRLKVIGEGDKETVSSYNWIIENSVHLTPGNTLKRYEEDHKDIIEGKVEGKFKESVFQSTTESVEFTIKYSK